MSDGINWVCDSCGRDMPHFYAGCPRCEKKQKVKDEAEGRIKRARDIKVGDTIAPRFSLLPTILVQTLDVTHKGKIHVNRGQGSMGGEYIFQPEQWVDICNPTPA